MTVMRRALIVVALSAALTMAAPARSAEQPKRAAERLDTSGPMTHEKYAQYVATFNRADGRFVEYYAPDVVFDKGKVEGVLKGREAIGAWYRNIWADMKETITPLAVAIDPERNLLIVELRTELVALHDGVKRPTETLNKGDRIVVDGAIVYTLRDGLITSLRGTSDERHVVRATKK